MKKICILLGLLLLASSSSGFAQTGIRILMVVTGSGQISENKPTGLWLEEFAVPYLRFKETGFEVTVASPKGGQAPVDPRSLKDGGKVLEWARAAVELEKTVGDRRRLPRPRRPGRRPETGWHPPGGRQNPHRLHR